MVAVARRRETAAGTLVRGWPRWPRPALAGVLGVAVAVGACVMPAEYPVSLGYGFEVTIDADRWQEIEPEAIAMHIKDRLDVERIELRVVHLQHEHEGEGGAATVSEGVRMQLFVFGEALDVDALEVALQARFPVLAEVELREMPLFGTVHGTFGGQLSHRFLDLTIDRHGVEEAERRVLAQLVAEGIAPEHATIDITERHGADGERRIEVRVEAEQ